MKMFMKYIIALFSAILLLIAVPTYANAAYVQGKGDNNDSATQVSTTFDSPVTAGSLLVLAVRLKGAGHVTVTSTGSPTWTENNWVDSGYGWSVGVYSAPNVPSGTTTVTVTVPGSATSVRLGIYEYSGIATTAPAHKTATGTGTSGSVTTGYVTTTIDNCTLFCAVGTDTDLMGYVAGSGYTLRLNALDSGDKIQGEDHGPVAAGTYSGTMSLSSDTWAAILVAYKPASSVSSPPAPPLNLLIK